MGHRALVVVETDGFDCYRSQWGGLASLDPAAVVESVADGTPLERGVSAAGVLALLDPRADEALLVRSGDGTVRYLVRWLGVPAAGTDGDGPVVLAPVSDPGTAARLDCALRTLKGVLGDAVDAGLLGPRGAVAYLATVLAGHPDLPDGTLWLAPREVRRGR